MRGGSLACLPAMEPRSHPLASRTSQAAAVVPTSTPRVYGSLLLANRAELTPPPGRLAWRTQSNGHVTPQHVDLRMNAGRVISSVIVRVVEAGRGDRRIVVHDL